jgi:hypothetical protein
MATLAIGKRIFIIRITITLFLATILVALLSIFSWSRIPSPHLYYNIGGDLELEPNPESSFLGLFYRQVPEDSITLLNKSFLRERLRKMPEYQESTRFVLTGRRYKLIYSDSAFVSLYISDYFADEGHAFFMLNDLKGGKKYFLQDFTVDDFNTFIDDQKLREPYDYFSMAHNYTILSRIKANIYFIDSGEDLFSAYSIESSWASKEEFRGLSKFDKLIEEPNIQNYGDSTVVSFFVYESKHPQIDKMIYTFEGAYLKTTQEINIVDTDQFLKALGIKKYKKRNR